MSVNISTLFAQLDKITEQLKTEELEPAVAEAAALHHLLTRLFKENQPEQLDVEQLQRLQIQLNQHIELLIKKQLEIQNQVAAISEVGSNKVSRTYLAK